MMTRLASFSTLLSGLGLLVACSSSPKGNSDTGGATTSSTSGTASTSTSGAGGASTGNGGASSSGSSSSSSGSPTTEPKVFLILMENNNWSTIKGSASAPYINSLLATGAHAEQYYNPPGNHPSEPNYLWLEAGTNFGVLDDSDPSVNSQTTTAHLVTQLAAAGHTWKAYEEDISGTVCPLTAVADYAPKHCPMVFFTDVTNDNSASAPICLAHVRPYTELATDLAANATADYNFITPNLCDDMHGAGDCTSSNYVQLGDTWLSQQVPIIQASTAYKNGAVILITWDEGEGGDGPIGMIALGNSVKVNYSNTVHYTHSSTLRTMQEIFGLSPFLGDAATAGTNDLSDLFTKLP